MAHLIVERIERLAKLEHGGDFTKAAAQYFREHPEDRLHYNNEVTEFKKRVGADRERINSEMQYRMELIAHRDNLDLTNPAHRVSAQEKVIAENPGLYKSYRDASSVRVGKVSLSD